MPESFDVHIDTLVAGGRGHAIVDGLHCFVPYAVPGDHLRIGLTKRHRGYCEAEILEILAPSPDRVTPPCPVFGQCGGCQWQHIRYDTQVLWKERILREQLVRIGRLRDPEVLPTIAAASQWHYRTRIQLQLDKVGRVGFYRSGSNEVIEFEECLIAVGTINEQLAAAKARLRGEGSGRHLRIDDAQGFSQVNLAQNSILQELVGAGVAKYGGGRVLELHCGSGNLTRSIAEVATEVTAVDDDAGAIAQAQTLSLAHVEFLATSAQAIVQKMVGQKASVDGVVLDPPRRGAAEVMSLLLKLQPQWIGYVSCDPATLARDIRTLVNGGYHHVSSQPIDMFPQTFHIESLTWLQRGGAQRAPRA